MKRIACVWLVVLALMLNLCPVSFAADDIKVVINGEEQIYDQNPVIINDRTFVPMRAIFESLGASVEWNAEEKSVTAVKDYTNIKIGIGKKYATVNGKSVKLDASACIINDRTLVPVRFVSESLGAIVKWNDAERKVEITYEELYRNSIDFENINSFKDYILGGGMNGKVTVEKGIDHEGKNGQYVKVEGFQTKSHRFKIHNVFPEKYVGNKFTVSMWVMSPDIPSLVIVGAYGITDSLYATRPTASEGFEIEAGNWTNIVFEYDSVSEIATMLGLYYDKSNIAIPSSLYIDDIEIICTKSEDSLLENEVVESQNISGEVINALEKAEFIIDYSFNDLDSVNKDAFASGANYNMSGLSVTDLYDIDDNGKSLSFAGRTQLDHRLKIEGAFSEENIGKKYVISMWAYLPNVNSEIKVSTFGKYGTEYAYKAVDSKVFSVKKGEWTQLAFIVEHNEPLITMVGIEQNKKSNLAAEIYIDDIKIGIIE